MARRFFVDEENIKLDGENINVIGNEVHHINVLRHKVGDIIKINEYDVEITDISQNEINGKILGKDKSEQLNKHKLTLYQSYIKSDKMEYVVQKAVELGVNNIVPFLSKNCVVKLDEKDKLKKSQRLNKISLEASKQCGRPDIVKVEDVLNISSIDFIDSLNKNDYNILAYEKSNNSLKQAMNSILKGSKSTGKMISIGVIIGPEGGFDKSDIDILNKANNMIEVSLGTNILRAETASLNLLSIINYEFNE